MRQCLQRFGVGKAATRTASQRLAQVGSATRPAELVDYLIRGIKCKNSEMPIAVAVVKADRTGMAVDFEAAQDFLKDHLPPRKARPNLKSANVEHGEEETSPAPKVAQNDPPVPPAPSVPVAKARPELPADPPPAPAPRPARRLHAGGGSTRPLPSGTFRSWSA